MSHMVSIEARAVGRKGPIIPSWSIPLPFDTESKDGLTLSELIKHVVLGEVQAFEERRQAQLFLRALSPEDIDEGVARGKVSPGNPDTVGPAVDPEAALAVALQAFEDGLYLVLVDEVEIQQLSDPVPVQESSTVVFLRLTFLSGA